MQKWNSILYFSAMSVLFGCASPQVSTTTTSADKISPNFKVIGHRGAAAYAPENTLPSFAKAKAMGVKEVELDIQLSKDGELVLFHDATMEKKTGFKGQIHDYTWKQLQKAEIGTWFDRERGTSDTLFKGTKLTLLKDLLTQYHDDFFFHIEIKAGDTEIPGKLLTLLKEKNLLDRAIVTSFFREQLVHMRALTTTLSLCYLIDDEKTPDIDTEIRSSQTAKFTQVAIRAPVMTGAQVTLAHSLNLNIRAWGIKDRKDMETALRAGAEGMTIDWPDWLLQKQNI